MRSLWVSLWVPVRSLWVPPCPSACPRGPAGRPRCLLGPSRGAAVAARCGVERSGAALTGARFPPAVPELHPAALRQKGGRRLRGVHVAHGGLLRLQLLRLARLRPPAEPASGSGLDTAASGSGLRATASGSGLHTAASGSRSPSLWRPPPPRARSRSPPPLYSPAPLVANKRLRFVRTNRVAPPRHRASRLAHGGVRSDPLRPAPPPSPQSEGPSADWPGVKRAGTACPALRRAGNSAAL